MNIGELTATLGADIKELRASVDKAEKIVREYSRTVDKELDKTDRSWNKTGNTVRRQTTRINKDIKSTSESMKQMKSHALALRSAVSIIGTGMALKSIFDVGKEVDMLKISYKAIFGTMEKAADEFKYVKQVSDEMGQNFYVIAKQFKSLSAASKGTTLEGKGVHDIFRAITKASASLGLTAYETEGALYAVQQMISKATVQSEELRGQLGERLPGAFRMAAEAMGMTMPQLSKQLELGNIMAEDLLPKLARVLENTYSGEVSEAVEASNKLSEAWKTLRYNIAKSGFLSEASHSIMSLAQTMDSPALQSSLRDIGVGLGQMIKDSRRLIPLLKDLTSGLGGVVSVLGRLSDVYSAFPSEITSGAGAGIIMRILTGSTPVGVVTALLVTLNQAMEKLNQQWKAMLPTMQSMGKEGSNFSNSIQNIMDVLNGNRDWNTGEFTESGKQRNSANRRADLREKYAGTWASYDADAERQVALINEEYEKKQRAHQQFREQKDRERAILSGTYIAPKTEQDLKEYNSFYADLDKLRGVGYEKELKDLRIEKEIHAATINDKLAAEEWFQIKKKELQDKYKKNYVLGNSESDNHAELRKEAADYAATIPDLAEKRAAHQGVDLDAIRKEYENKIKFQEQWKEMHAKATMSSTEFELYQLNKTLELVKDNVENKAELDEWYVARRNEILKDTYEKEKTWQDALVDGFKEAADDIGWTYDNIKSAVQAAFSNMTDTLTDFVMTGKASFSDFAESVVRDMVKMQIQASITQPLASGLGDLFGSFGQSMANAWYGNVSAVGAAGPMPQANGGVFQSPSLHAYANTVQTSPKLFTFAQGGVFAEAGPEAVMPLKRGANGRLGVEATGASGDTYITYNVDAKGAKPGVEEAIIMALKDLNDNLESRAIRAVVSEANKGGSFAKAVGRR